MEAITAWMQAHPEYSGLAVFVLTFVESFAFVGALVPGVVIIFAASAIIASTGSMGLLPLLAIAAIASYIANVLSFFIGYRSKDRIRHMAWFQRHQPLVDKGEAFFHTWGPLSVVTGRFIGPIRPFVAFVAGTLSMSPRQFILLDSLTVLVWAPVYVMPGYMTGLAVEELPTTMDWQSVIWLTGGALTAITLFALGNFWLQSHAQKYQGLAYRLGMDELPLASLTLVITCAIMLMALIVAMPLTLDQSLTDGLLGMRQEWVFNFFVVVTSLGDPEFLMLMTGLWVAFFTVIGNWRAGLLLAIAMVTAQLVVSSIKLGFAIPRPNLAVGQPESFSFPSGHTAGMFVLAGMVTAFLNEGRPLAKRWQLYALVSLPIILVAYSRIYVSVHWLTDIVGGLLVGSVICGFCRLVYHKFRTHFVLFNRQTFLALGFFTLVTVSYLMVRWPWAVADYQLL